MDLTVKEGINNKGDKISYRLRKDEFLDTIENEVRKSMQGIDIDSLQYPNADISKVLLLFNVLSVIENQRSDIKFPFDKYKKEKWDKEHIASKTDKDKAEIPQDNMKRIAWIDDMLYYFTGIKDKEARAIEGNHTNNADEKKCDVVDQVKNYIEKTSKIVKDIKDENQRNRNIAELDIIKDLLDAKKLSTYTSRQRSASGKKEEYDALMKKLFSSTKRYFNEDRIAEQDKNGLGNMAILNASINRSYGNAFFAIKRMHIQDKDSEGVFIPLATKNVFMKYYSKRVDNMLVWTNDDAKAYVEAIKNKISRFINK